MRFDYLFTANGAKVGLTLETKHQMHLLVISAFLIQFIYCIYWLWRLFRSSYCYKQTSTCYYLQICFSCQRVSRGWQSVRWVSLSPRPHQLIFTLVLPPFFRSQVFTQSSCVIRISNQKMIKTQDALLSPRGKGNRILDKLKPRRREGEKGWQR